MKKYDKFIWIIFLIQLVVITVVLTTSKVDDMTLAKGKMHIINKHQVRKECYDMDD